MHDLCRTAASWMIASGISTKAMQPGSAELGRPPVPIATPRKKGGQQAFETQWTADRLEENATGNRIRERVDLWRRGGRMQATPETRCRRHRPGTTA